MLQAELLGAVCKLVSFNFQRTARLNEIHKLGVNFVLSISLFVHAVKCGFLLSGGALYENFVCMQLNWIYLNLKGANVLKLVVVLIVSHDDMVSRYSTFKSVRELEITFL